LPPAMIVPNIAIQKPHARKVLRFSLTAAAGMPCGVVLSPRDPVPGPVHEIPVHACSVPTVPKLAGLIHGQLNAVRPKQSQRPPCREPHTQIVNAVPATLAHDPAENLAATPIVGVKDGRIRAISHLAAHGTDEFSIVPRPKVLRIAPPSLPVSCVGNSLPSRVMNATGFSSV
jgi:hypothetical protein